MGSSGLGIEITSSTVRLAVLSRRRGAVSVLSSKTVELPDGIVSESYGTPNILDADVFSEALRTCLAGVSPGIRRTALSLPDGVFRVQTLEFDELPDAEADRERLIRWRIEKSAAFDISDTVLRYQVLPPQGKGFSVLACIIKRAVLEQYESALAGLGLEPWSIGVSSFSVLNFYLPYISRKAPVAGLAHIARDSFATLILDAGGAVRFYRYKEIKQRGADDVKARFLREIEDSLHFYTHMDHAQRAEIKTLYLTGDSLTSLGLADGLRSLASFDVDVPTPSVVIPSANGAGGDMAAALGAGSSL